MLHNGRLQYIYPYPFLGNFLSLSSTVLIVAEKDEYVPDLAAPGFFPPAKLAKRQPTAPDKPLQAPYPIMPDGFVPNSVLVRLLWPPEQKEALKRAYKPPKLTQEQLDLLKKHRKVHSCC